MANTHSTIKADLSRTHAHHQHICPPVTITKVTLVFQQHSYLMLTRTVFVQVVLSRSVDRNVNIPQKTVQSSTHPSLLFNISSRKTSVKVFFFSVSKYLCFKWGRWYPRSKVFVFTKGKKERQNPCCSHCSSCGVRARQGR